MLMSQIVKQYNVNALIERLCEFRERGMGEALICLRIGEQCRSMTATMHCVMSFIEGDGSDSPDFNCIVLSANDDPDSSLVIDPVPITDENRECFAEPYEE